MPDAVYFSIGLWDGMNVICYFHDFLSTPILLNSSELMFETSRSAPAMTANTSKQITTTATNMGCLLSYFDITINRFLLQKFYPLTVLLCSWKRLSFQEWKGYIYNVEFGFLFQYSIRFLCGYCCIKIRVHQPSTVLIFRINNHLWVLLFGEIFLRLTKLPFEIKFTR